MTVPLLLIGEPLGSGLEIAETAELLGYEPIAVIFRPTEVQSRFEEVMSDVLPGRLSDAAVFPIGVPLSDTEFSLRADRRWLLSTKRAVDFAIQSGLSRWVNLVHPTAHVSPSARLETGVFVGPLATVSSGAHVESYAVIGRSSSLGHHSSVGEYSRLGPGAVVPGGVSLGSNVVVGPAASFVNGIRIAPGAFIGSGAVVTRHIRGPHQVMGNPARRLRRPVALVRRGVKRFVRKSLRRTGLYRRAREVYRATFG